jgi:hypothetical protein
VRVAEIRHLMGGSGQSLLGKKIAAMKRLLIEFQGYFCRLGV